MKKRWMRMRDMPQLKKDCKHNIKSRQSSIINKVALVKIEPVFVNVSRINICDVFNINV